MKKNRLVHDCVGKALLFFVGVILVEWPLAAAEYRAGRTFMLPPGETVKGNLYVAASEISLSGDVDGDLVSAGENVFLTGNVSDNATILAGTTNLSGRVGKDLRVTGGRVNVNGRVEGDLVVAGGEVLVLSGATVGGNAVVTGGRLLLEGPVNGAVRAANREVLINNAVGGDVDVSASWLTVGGDARIGGALHYWSPRLAIIQPSAVIHGPVTFHGRPYHGLFWGISRRMGIAFIFLSFPMVLTASLVGFFAFRNGTKALIRYTRQNFWAELLRGFLLMIVIPLVLFIVAATVIGLPVAFLGGLLWLAIGMIAWVYAGILLGSVLLKTFRKEESELTWRVVVGGIVLLFILSFVPLVGQLLYMVFFLALFGGLFQQLWLKVRQSRTHPSSMAQTMPGP